MDIKLFMDAIGGDLVALLSGIGSVVLLILGLTIFYKKDTPRWVVLSVAAVCFFCAAARIWTTEHRTLVKTRDDLLALNSPQLVLTIDELGVGTLRLGQQSQSGIMVVANLVNRGAPSIAEDWVLSALLTDGRSASAGTMYVDPRGGLRGKGDLNWTVSGKDALYDKAANRAIQKGEKLRGVLAFRFKQFTEEELKTTGTKYRLQCVDVNGKGLQAEFTFTGNSHPYYYLPGVGPILDRPNQ